MSPFNPFQPMRIYQPRQYCKFPSQYIIYDYYQWDSEKTRHMSIPGAWTSSKHPTSQNPKDHTTEKGFASVEKNS